MEETNAELAEYGFNLTKDLVQYCLNDEHTELDVSKLLGLASMIVANIAATVDEAEMGDVCRVIYDTALSYQDTPAARHHF